MKTYETNFDTVVLEKAQACQLLVLDVDGVLSDGKLVFDNNGVETKSFNVKDGLGIKLLQQFGVEVAIITGRTSHIVEKRASSLGIKHIIQGREDKGAALKDLATSLNIAFENCAYMGDDLPDLSAMMQVGFSVAPSNAHKEVKKRVDYVTSLAGGEGAVRQLCDMLLQAQGRYDEAIASFLTKDGTQW